MSDDILGLTPPSPHRVVRYGDGRSAFGHLWLPERTDPSTPLPVVVCVHGGFWRAAYSLDHVGHLCAALAAEGWAVWSIEYRRLGERGGGWPNTLLDAGRATDFIRSLKIEGLTLDLERVVAAGHSAGGHLALWLAGRHRIPPDSDLYVPDPLPLRGVVALSPVADLEMAARRRLSADVTVQLLGATPQRAPERYAAADPVHLVPTGVPAVLVHGQDDTIVPPALSQTYVSAARAAGDEAALHLLPGIGHFEVIDPRSAAYPIVREALRGLVARQRP